MTDEQFREVLNYLKFIVRQQKENQEQIMAQLDTETALVQTIDTNVNNVIAEVQALKAQGVDTSGLDAALQKLNSDVTTALGDAAPASSGTPSTGGSTGTAGSTTTAPSTTPAPTTTPAPSGGTATS